MASLTFHKLFHHFLQVFWHSGAYLRLILPKEYSYSGSLVWGKKKWLWSIWGDPASESDVSLLVPEHILIQAYAAERSPWLYRGPLVEPMGTGMTVLEKGGKWVRKKRSKMTILGSPAPTARASWPLWCKEPISDTGIIANPYPDNLMSAKII